MKRELRLTKDGSHSIYIPEMDEQYHSMHGSIVEAEKVYVEYGLAAESGIWNLESGKTILLLEMGFGTGLNALLTWKYAQDHGLKITYVTIEKYPITAEELTALNYATQLGLKQEMLQRLHEADWGKKVELDEHFSIYKMQEDLREVELAQQFDLVYFDAFAPEKQPHLWAEEVFEKLYAAMKEGGVLTTYCVKGEIRRRLQKVGFQIEKLPGPKGGKREVLRAIKK